MQHLSWCLVDKLIEYGVITQENKEIYLYGVELMLNSSLASLCILLMGFILGKPLLAVVFIVCISNLRHYAGGYHARSYILCFLLSCGTFLLSLVGEYWQQRYELRGSIIGVSILCTLYLWIKGTVNSAKNPKTDGELQIRKRWTRIYTTLYSLVSCILLVYTTRYWDMATMIVCTQAWAALAVYMSQIRKEKEEQ